MLKGMRWRGLLFVIAVLGGCGEAQLNPRDIAEAQVKSVLGPTASWKLDEAISRSEIQKMRDRAYQFCIHEMSSETSCLNDQDHSLFEYARSFALVRIFREEANPEFPYAKAHKADPAAFQRINKYCRSVYESHKSGDARMLGPCMAARVGGDFFNVIPVS